MALDEFLVKNDPCRGRRCVCFLMKVFFQRNLQYRQPPTGEQEGQLLWRVPGSSGRSAQGALLNIGPVRKGAPGILGHEH